MAAIGSRNFRLVALFLFFCLAAYGFHLYSTMDIFEDCLHGHRLRVLLNLRLHPELIKAKKDGDTPLHMAVRSGSPWLVRLLLKRGADVAERNARLWSPLHLAANPALMDGSPIEDKPSKRRDGDAKPPLLPSGEAHKRIIELLIDYHAIVNRSGPQGLTPLCVASDPDAAETLKAKGAWIEFPQKWTSLQVALANGWKEKARWLINLHTDRDPTLLTSDGALHWAAQYGLPETVSSLVEKGFNPNQRNKEGRTPLLLAVHERRSENVKVLLDLGVDPNQQDRDWGTALQIGAENGDRETALLLLGRGVNVDGTSYSSSESPFSKACRAGNLEMAELLLDHGADVNFRDKRGLTPLHIASSLGRTEIIKFLLEKGANINAMTDGQRSPLFLAGNVESASLLLNNGANLTLSDGEGESILHRLAAVRGESPELMSFFIGIGANVMARDNQGSTPLHEAANNGHVQTAEILINAGASVDATDNNGVTPLIAALYSRPQDEVIARALLEKGADCNATDKNGETPLMAALKKGSFKIAELLFARGADGSGRTKNGDTYLHALASSLS